MAARLTIWLATTMICAVMTFGGVQNENLNEEQINSLVNYLGKQLR